MIVKDPYSKKKNTNSDLITVGFMALFFCLFVIFCLLALVFVVSQENDLRQKEMVMTPCEYAEMRMNRNKRDTRFWQDRLDFLERSGRCPGGSRVDTEGYRSAYDAGYAQCERDNQIKQ